MNEPVRVSAGGAEIAMLAGRLTTGLAGAERRLVGIVGAPGAGKSSFAAALVREVGGSAGMLPMDGFHLADVTLDRLGLLDRKGAPETFDVWGYAALLERVRQRPAYPVYAPGFSRDLEQPVAGAVVVGPELDLVVTEGNYLLLDRPGWREVRSRLDETWYVVTDEEVRRHRLVVRHVASGKSPAAARAWVQRVDEPNAVLVATTRDSADRVVDLSEWRPGGQT